MKIILFFPYAIYSYLKKRRKSERDAYSAAVFCTALYFYIAILIFFEPSRNFINYLGEIFGVEEYYNVTKYLFSIPLFLIWLLIIKKKTLDSLIYTPSQKLIVGTICIFMWLAPILFIFFIILNVLL